MRDICRKSRFYKKWVHS